LAGEYFRRAPQTAQILFVEALQSWEGQVVLGGSLAWAVLTILPKISLSETVLGAAINLARRTPEDTLTWAVIDEIWQRRDLTPALRRLFYVDEGSP